MVLSLKLADVPSHPFAKEAFETTLWLMDGSELVCGRSVPVSLSLHFEDRTAAPASLLETEGRGSPAVGKQGSCALKLKVAEASLDHENRSFVVRATCAVDGVAVETWSEPMKVMRLKLEIEGGGVLDHDPEEQKKTKDKAAVWYKDEGGREKCIELNVSLHDGRRNLVKDRNVRLKCVLRYAASELPVTNQQVLKVWADGGGGAGSPNAPPELVQVGALLLGFSLDEANTNWSPRYFQRTQWVDPRLAYDVPAGCDVAYVYLGAYEWRTYLWRPIPYVKNLARWVDGHQLAGGIWVYPDGTVFESRLVNDELTCRLDVTNCVETKYSTRIKCARTRQFRRNLFSCASRTRREQSIRPKISRIDFDLTELENSQVWSGPPKPVVEFHTGDEDALRPPEVRDRLRHVHQRRDVRRAAAPAPARRARGDRRCEVQRAEHVEARPAARLGDARDVLRRVPVDGGHAPGRGL